MNNNVSLFCVLVFIVSLTCVSVSGLSCVTCEAVRCASPESLNCSLGAVEVKCGCCHECKKAAGEECGGSFDIFGTCADGLICVGGYLWFNPGYCKTPEQVESDRTSTTYSPGNFSTTTPPPWAYVG